MTRLIVIAVLALAAIAAADTIRPAAKETRTQEPAPRTEPRHPVTSSGFAPAGDKIRNKVLLHGREYLGPDEIAQAFPEPLPGELFAIAHLAAAADGTLVLAVYGFAPGGEAADAIQVWRRRELESSFLVRPGTFGGGIGFADDGRLIAALSPDGIVVNLFTRTGKPAGRQSPTSW